METRIEILENFQNGYITRSEMLNKLFYLIIKNVGCRTLYSIKIFKRFNNRYDWER